MAWSMLLRAMTAPQAKQVIFPPARNPIEAVWPILVQLTWLPMVTPIFSPRGLPRGYYQSQRLLIVHIILSYIESARFHYASLRYNIPDSPWWSPASAPPLPTALDLVLTVVNCWLALWIAKPSRYGNPKIVRTSLQMTAVLRLLLSVPAFLAMRQAKLLANGTPLAHFYTDVSLQNSTISAAAISQAGTSEIATQLAKAARYYGASCGALDGFPMTRMTIVAFKLAGWFSSSKDAGSWGTMLGLCLRAYTIDLPGGLWSIYGLMFILNAIQDFAGRAIRKREFQLNAGLRALVFVGLVDATTDSELARRRKGKVK